MFNKNDMKQKNQLPKINTKEISAKPISVLPGKDSKTVKNIHGTNGELKMEVKTFSMIDQKNSINMVQVMEEVI